MTWVQRLRCDACGREAEPQHTRGWYHVNRAFGFGEDDSDSWDFCTLPCVSSWASSREIVRVAS